MPTGQGAGIGCLRCAVGMRTHPGRITCGGISDASRGTRGAAVLVGGVCILPARSRCRARYGMVTARVCGRAGGRCVLPGCDRLNLACLRLRCVMRCGAWHGMAWGGAWRGGGVCLPYRARLWLRGTSPPVSPPLPSAMPGSMVSMSACMCLRYRGIPYPSSYKSAGGQGECGTFLGVSVCCVVCP